MPNKLDKILISASDPEWHEKIRVIHDNVKRATCFEDRSDEDNQLNKILQGVKNNKDTALREYTDAFDKVKLTPEQFRVSKEDLEKAHKQIDPKLLKSIRQSIQNVTKYQIDALGYCVPIFLFERIIPSLPKVFLS